MLRIAGLAEERERLIHILVNTNALLIHQAEVITAFLVKAIVITITGPAKQRERLIRIPSHTSAAHIHDAKIAAPSQMIPIAGQFVEFGRLSMTPLYATAFFKHPPEIAASFGITALASPTVKPDRQFIIRFDPIRLILFGANTAVIAIH